MKQQRRWWGLGWTQKNRHTIEELGHAVEQGSSGIPYKARDGQETQAQAGDFNG